MSDIYLQLEKNNFACSKKRWKHEHFLRLKLSTFYSFACLKMFQFRFLEYWIWHGEIKIWHDGYLMQLDNTFESLLCMTFTIFCHFHLVSKYGIFTNLIKFNHLFKCSIMCRISHDIKTYSDTLRINNFSNQNEMKTI